MGLHDNYLVMMPGDFGCWCFCGCSADTYHPLKTLKQKRPPGWQHRSKTLLPEPQIPTSLSVYSSDPDFNPADPSSSQQQWVEEKSRKDPDLGGESRRSVSHAWQRCPRWKLGCNLSLLVFIHFFSFWIWKHQHQLSSQEASLKPQFYFNHSHKCQGCVRTVMEIELFY